MDRSIYGHKNSAPLPVIGTSGSSREGEGEGQGRVPSTGAGFGFSAGCSPAAVFETLLIAGSYQNGI